MGRENCLFIHVTLIPYLKFSGEHKSKPTQHSVKELQSFGIMPNIIVTRCDEDVEEGVLKKIAQFCNVKEDCVIPNLTVPVLYQAPIMLEELGLARVVLRELSLDTKKECDLKEWNEMLNQISSMDKEVKIALVGKYVKLHDSYLSVSEALTHGGFKNSSKVDIKWVDSDELNESNIDSILGDCDGIILPGGFGSRGIEGMILSAKYARENNIPFLGICLGMQIAVIEFARNVLGFTNANSREFDENGEKCVIDLMLDQQGNIPKGGTMRLGAYPCHIQAGTKLEKIYKKDIISERHRHRYEFSSNYKEEYEKAGALVSGLSPDSKLVEAIELKDNDFFVAVQYHPEFKSRPNNPHPLFVEFIKSSLENRKRG